MSETYLKEMLIIVYNLGGEMVYIIYSFKTQNIPIDKAIKVIQDVVSNLFSRIFISELNKHNIMNKHQDILQIYDNL